MIITAKESHYKISWLVGWTAINEITGGFNLLAVYQPSPFVLPRFLLDSSPGPVLQV